MDSQPVQQPPTQTATNSFQQPIKKHPRTLSFLIKIVLFFVIAVALLLGGYYLGTQSNPITASPKPIPTMASIPTKSPTPPPPTPTPASLNTKKITAGLSGSSAFQPYTIDMPTDWTDARETTITAGIDKLTFTKNSYLVTIYQSTIGGDKCVYKGDKPQTLAQTFTDFADINGKSGHYRRSWNQNGGQSITYTICQKADDGSYSTLTTFGAISIVSPNPATTAMLSEIDGMIASLVKQ